MTAVGLYAYADDRYHECIEDGNHPWWAVDPTYIVDVSEVCDRAVFGDVLVERPSEQPAGHRRP